MSGLGYVPPAFPEPPEEAEAFGRVLFQVAQDHLDPERERLEWSEGFAGAYGPDVPQGPREYGRKADLFDHGPGKAFGLPPRSGGPDLRKRPCRRIGTARG